MWILLEPIAHKVFDYLEKNDNYGRTVNLKMKTTDFQIYTRSKTFQREIRNRDTFRSIALELLTQYWTEADTVRLLAR